MDFSSLEQVAKAKQKTKQSSVERFKESESLYKQGLELLTRAEQLNFEDKQLTTQASELFVDSIVTNRKNINPYLKIAIILIIHHDIGNAIAYINEALRINPDHPEALKIQDFILNNTAPDVDAPDITTMTKDPVTLKPNLKKSVPKKETEQKKMGIGRGIGALQGAEIQENTGPLPGQKKMGIGRGIGALQGAEIQEVAGPLPGQKKMGIGRGIGSFTSQPEVNSRSESLDLDELYDKTEELLKSQIVAVRSHTSQSTLILAPIKIQQQEQMIKQFNEMNDLAISQLETLEAEFNTDELDSLQEEFAKEISQLEKKHKVSNQLLHIQTAIQTNLEDIEERVNLAQTKSTDLPTLEACYERFDKIADQLDSIEEQGFSITSVEKPYNKLLAHLQLLDQIVHETT